MHKTDTYLVVRASGGLSNRLQALLGGIAYCLLTGRKLCVDWRDGLYSDDFSNVFSQWFTLKGVETASCKEVEDAYAKGATLSPPFWKEYLSEAIAVEYLFSGDSHMSEGGLTASRYDIAQLESLTHEHDVADILVYWGWNLEAIQSLASVLKTKVSRYAHMNLDAIPYALLQEHVVPTKAIREEVEQFFTQHFTSPPVGIHIRHSDLQSPLPAMLTKLQEVTTESQEIFLCTDNPLVEKMVRRLYPHCVTRTKIFQGVNVPLHCYVPGISNVEKGFDAVVEMLILAKCQHIIHYAPSSFARISILYSGLPAQCIHSVSKV